MGWLTGKAGEGEANGRTAETVDPVAARDFATLERSAPLRTARSGEAGLVDIDDVAAGATPDSILCREAILGRDERVAGYEFFLRRHLSPLRHGTDASRRLRDQVLLLNTLWDGIPGLLGHRSAVVTIHPASLDLPHLAKLVGKRMIACVDLAGGAAALDALAGQLRDARGRGLGLGVGGFARGMGLEAVLPHVRLVSIDIAGQGPADIAETARLARREAPAAKLLARNLQSVAELQACLGLGFDWFQGPFVTSREPWGGPAPKAADRIRLVRLLGEVQVAEDLERAAGALRTHPELSYRLLRHLNSPALGIARKVASVRDAVLYLGKDQLVRWLGILVLGSKDFGGRGESILESALIRGRTLELLAAGRLRASAQDALFTLGLMSLLPAAVQRPLAELLGELRLPEASHRALAEGAGPYAPYLALAIALERPDSAQDLAALCARCGTSVEEAAKAHFAAMQWAHAQAGAA